MDPKHSVIKGLQGYHNFMLKILSITQGSHKLWKSWKTWKITKKSSMHGKIMEFEKNRNNHGKSWNFMK